MGVTVADDEQTGERPQEAAYDVMVELRAVLGTADLPISQLLKLGRGAVVELDRKVNESIDVYVEGRRIAKADVQVVEDHLAIVISEVMKSSG